MSEKQQTTLFGAFVENEQDEPLQFVKIYEEVEADGDQFTMALNAASYNEDRDCITVIDSEKNCALTAYFTQHPESKYQSTPDGIRLGRAVQRAIRTTVNDGDELAQIIKERDMTLTVSYQGQNGRLWTVITNA
tara:strand:+ start:13902 stop:14303 length:402 start_codon:yes stop_codon:yes gene_type:complete